MPAKKGRMNQKWVSSNSRKIGLTIPNKGRHTAQSLWNASPSPFYLCFEHADNLGAHSASCPETGPPFSLIVVALSAMQNSSHLITLIEALEPQLVPTVHC
jgi:hypothetical protein